MISPPFLPCNKSSWSQVPENVRCKQRAEEDFTAPAPSVSSPVSMCEFLWYLHLKEEERAEGRQRGEGERGEPKERQPGESYSLFIYYFPLISLKALWLTCPRQRSQAALCLSKALSGGKPYFMAKASPAWSAKHLPTSRSPPWAHGCCCCPGNGYTC